MRKRLLAMLLAAVTVFTSITMPARAEEVTDDYAVEIEAEEIAEETEFIEDESNEIEIDEENEVFDEDIESSFTEELDLSEDIELNDVDNNWISLDRLYPIDGGEKPLELNFTIDNPKFVRLSMDGNSSAMNVVFGKYVDGKYQVIDFFERTYTAVGDYYLTGGLYYICIYAYMGECPNGFYTDLLVLTKDGVCPYNGNYFYCKNGSIDTSFTGIAKYNNGYYYFKNGVFTNYSGLVNYNGGWYYITNGCFKSGVNGVTAYGGSYYYVNNSQVTFKDTGLAQYNGGWYYFKNSAFCPSYTGLVNYGGSWWYVQGGCLKWGVNTCVNYGGKWYYVNNSKVDFSYTGYTTYGGHKYYVKNGVVQV